MPVHSKIRIYTFTFSDNPLLTQQDDSYGQYVCLPKIIVRIGPQTWEIWQKVLDGVKRKGDKIGMGV